MVSLGFGNHFSRHKLSADLKNRLDRLDQEDLLAVPALEPVSQRDRNSEKVGNYEFPYQSHTRFDPAGDSDA